MVAMATPVAWQRGHEICNFMAAYFKNYKFYKLEIRPV